MLPQMQLDADPNQIQWLGIQPDPVIKDPASSRSN